MLTEYNDMADELAKQGSKMEEENHQEEVSEGVIDRWIKEKTNIRWSRMWERSETGEWTRFMVGQIFYFL